jgi:hypothetical protein
MRIEFAPKLSSPTVLRASIFRVTSILVTCGMTVIIVAFLALLMLSKSIKIPTDVVFVVVVVCKDGVVEGLFDDSFLMEVSKSLGP